MQWYNLCNTVLLPLKVSEEGLSMFSHVLRMPKDPSAQAAPEFAASGANKYRARGGRHCTNLLSVLRTDLQEVGLGTLGSKQDLRELRMQAEDKTQ